MEKNKKTLKKTLKFLIALFLVCFCCFSSFAFDEKFYNSSSIYRTGKMKTSKVRTKKSRIEKGFYFDLVFETKNNSKIPVNYADIVIRHLKKMVKEKFGGEQGYVDSLFKCYKVFYKNDGDSKNFKVRFYVFAEKEKSLTKIKDFVRNNILFKSYNDIFKKEELIKETAFEDYKNLYSSSLLKRLKKLEKEIKKYYKKKNYKKINDIFSDFSQNISTTTNFLTTLTQNAKIKKISKEIQETLDYIIKNNLKKSKSEEEEEDYDEDEFYYEYDDDYEKDKFSDYFDDDDDKFFKLTNKKRKAFKYLKSLFVKFFKGCRVNADKLKEVEFSSFKNSLNSLSFNHSISPVKREITKYDGCVETITEI